MRRPALFFALAMVHVYLATCHLVPLFGGDVQWTHIWKGFGALAAVWVLWEWQKLLPVLLVLLLVPGVAQAQWATEDFTSIADWTLDSIGSQQCSAGSGVLTATGAGTGVCHYTTGGPASTPYWAEAEISKIPTSACTPCNTTSYTEGGPAVGITGSTTQDAVSCAICSSGWRLVYYNANARTVPNAAGSCGTLTFGVGDSIAIERRSDTTFRCYRKATGTNYWTDLSTQDVTVANIAAGGGAGMYVKYAASDSTAAQWTNWAGWNDAGPPLGTPTSGATATPTATPTATATSTAATATPTATLSATPTATATATVTATLTATPTATATPGPTTTAYRVSSSADDAEENNSTGVMVALTSSDIELTVEAGVPQTQGLRFANVLVPPGATITEAYVWFYNDIASPDSEQSGWLTAKVVIGAQKPAAGATPAPFVASNYNISSRATVAPTVQWQPTPWTTPGAHGEAQKTDSLVSIVQAAVNDANWVTGSSIVIIFRGTDATNYRTSASWDAGGVCATNACGAALHISYSLATPTPSATPTATATSTAATATPTATPSATATPTATATPVIVCPEQDAGCGPIIQNPLNDPTTMTIKWWTTTTSVGDDEVRYGTTCTTDGCTLGSSATHAAVTCETMTTDYRCHRVDLTGLTADTDYYYKLLTSGVIVQDSASADDGGAAIKFHTLPATAPSELKIAIMGDFGMTGSNEEAVRDRIDLNAPYDLLLSTGDNATNTGTLPEWEDGVLKVFKDRLRDTPSFFAVGNHDLNGGYDASGWPSWAQARILAAPGEVGSCRINSTNPGDRCTGNGDCTGGGTCNISTSPEEFFSFDAGNAHFVFISTMFGSESGSTDWETGHNQKQWLIDDLAATQKKWKFALFHTALYSCPLAGHGSNLVIRDRLAPIFEKYGVQLVFQGHDHVWNRSKWIDSYEEDGTAGQDGKGTYYIVQGNGGKNLTGRCKLTGGECTVDVNLNSCSDWMETGCDFPAANGVSDQGTSKWCSFGDTGEYGFSLLTITDDITLRVKHIDKNGYLIDDWTMPTPTPTPTPSATPTATLSATPTATPTLSATPTATPTLSATPTATPTLSATPTATPTLSATPTATPTLSATPTATLSATPTLTPTPTLSATPTPTATSTGAVSLWGGVTFSSGAYQ